MAGHAVERIGLGLMIWSLVACGGPSGSGNGSGPSLSAAQSKIVGAWTVNATSCNGSSIESSYVPASTSLDYYFDGAKLYQTRLASGCSQTTSMPYTFDGTTLSVPAGSMISITCSPANCTGSGMMAGSACGTTISASSSVAAQISFSGANMVVTESDSQGQAICSSFSGAVPFVLNMTPM